MLLQHFGYQCSPQTHRQVNFKICQFKHSLQSSLSSDDDQNTQYPEPVSHFPHFMMFQAMLCTVTFLPMFYVNLKLTAIEHHL